MITLRTNVLVAPIRLGAWNGVVQLPVQRRMAYVRQCTDSEAQRQCVVCRTWGEHTYRLRTSTDVPCMIRQLRDPPDVLPVVQRVLWERVFSLQPWVSVCGWTSRTAPRLWNRTVAPAPGPSNRGIEHVYCTKFESAICSSSSRQRIL